MWNQWAGVAAATPMPPIPAPQCPPPQPPPPTAAPPPPSTAPPPAPAEPSTGNTAAPIIGPMLPSTSTATTPSAPPASSGPYGQYTEAQYAALTPEQQYALQQHWQQWQAYQQEYAKWHAQYGEQYKREMAAAAATGQTMNLNNYYQQAPPQPQIQTPTQPQQQQPPPPPPPDSQQVTAKFTGTPQLYTQPPPPQLQPQALVQPQPQTIPVNQAPPNMHQPPLGGPFPNMGYPQWQQSYSQSQQPQPFNYNQPPPTFAQQPPNFGQIPNFQQPPPMVQPQAPPPSQPQPMPIAPPPVQQQPIPPYGNPNQQNRSGSNQNTSNNNKSQPNIDRNFNDSTGPNPNNWAPPSLNQDNDVNKNLSGNTSQWNPKQNKFDGNFSNNRAGNQSGPNEMGPNNWPSRKDDGGDANDYNDVSNDGDMNTAFEGNRKSRDGFESKGNSNNRWGCENSDTGEHRNENFPQTRQGPPGMGNQWNNNNRNQGGMNNAWNNSPFDSQNNFENDRRNVGNFIDQRNFSGPNDQSGGNRWGNNSGQWGNNNRDPGSNNFNPGPGESGRNFGGNNFMHGPNNNFHQRFGQNDRNFGGNFNQRPGGNGRGYGPNNNSNQQFGNNERNMGPNNPFNDDSRDNFAENKDSNDRRGSNNPNFGNRNNFNRWSDNNDPNFSPGNSLNTGPEGSGKNSSFNPFNSRSHSNDRNFVPGGDGDNFGPNNFNQANRGNGRNLDRNDNFNPRFGSNERNFGPNNFNRRSDSNERNLGPNNMKERSNSNERNFNNNNFDRRSNSNERVRDSLPTSSVGRQEDREELQRGSVNQGNREPEIQNQGQSRLETDNGNKAQRPDLDEKSFDLQFQRWEEQFQQWKRANANHPDREMYRRYEQEFEKQRQRIMERREQMRQRKLQQMGNEAEPDDSESCDKDERMDNNPPIETKKDPDDEEEDVRSEHVGEDEGSNQALTKEERTTIMAAEINAVEERVDEKEEEQKQLDDVQEDVKEVPAKVDCPEIGNASSKNNDLPIAEKKTNSSVSSIGKRKSRFSAPTESEKKPKLQDTAPSEVISLVDEDDNTAAEVPGPMCSIFGKTEGIPGLDLVEGSGKSDIGSVDKPPSNTADESVEIELNEAPKEKKKEVQNPCNKIPSLFDVVIEKPADFPIRSPIGDNDEDENDDNDNDNGEENMQKENPSGQQLIHPNISNAIPNLGDALRDPAFMQKISQALAKAQGRESADPSCAPPPKFLQQLPMLLEQLQQQKSNSDGQRSSFGGNGPNNFGGNGPNFGGIGPNFGGIGPNFGGCGPNFGGNGPNYGGNDNGPNRINFGGNGPNFGDNGQNRMNFGGNGRNFGDNGPNRQNFGGNGPNFRGYDPNFGGNEPNFGFNGPNGGNGPNGPNFNRNGPNFNRNGPNFNRFGPNGSNFGGGDGPNFRGDGPNFRGGNGPNMAGGGNGPNFGRNGPNDDRRNFGRNNNNMGDRDSGGQNLFRHGGGNGNTGPEDKRKQSAGSGADATGTDNSNSSWVEGPGNSRDYGDDFFRPVQVIDYQNSTVSRPKVIDYGHKGSSASGSLSNPFNTNAFSFTDEFKPVKTFDYGHLSNPGINRYGNKPSIVNPKKKNKKKKKNFTAQQNRNAPQDDCANGTAAPIPEYQQENTETENKSEDDNSHQTANPTERINSNVSSPKGTNEELEEISDNEDNLENNRDNDSPAPPPPPMLTSNKPFICSVQHNATEPTHSLFPSTAAANENIPNIPSGHVQMSFPSIENKNTITVDEILLNPGRLTRPKKVCVILRGPPGSGKSHVAKLIKEKEIEMGGSNPRVLSIDDYFLIENDYEERCPKTGKKIPKKEVLYEYDADMEETYMQYLIKSFKKTISDNLYDFIIIDCNNNSLRTLNEFYCHSKDSGFMPYIVDLLCDLETCLDRNTHDRSEKDIKAIINTWKPTPFHYIKLDVASLLENLVEMEDAEDMVMDNNSNGDVPDDSNLTQPQADNETEDSNEAADTMASFGFLKSKWENDTSSENLARLDGTNKLMQKRKAATMEDYLQIDDWEPPKTNANGKKRVRWADIEEKRAQEKMRAIGFVVGQTDWKRMMDPNAGNRALNKTKYIERVNKRR
ncbi:putative uncharacterized protein DDB_G0282133 [Anastrepha ludens]|uniref:putative uncharacterized protein DDB_G0282133 n=1 Tax=Anastrepha ludens TaxID=28586 RepID=UPI0023B00A40|nr:putative uncharacterized protein DDB_G0282133 [Anastrepha ludens]